MQIIKTVQITTDKLYPDDVPYFTDNRLGVTVTAPPKSSAVTYVAKPSVTYNDKGLLLDTHQHNFYYRMLIEPNNLALGLLTTATAQTINVWNGYDARVTIVSIESINLPGFVLTPKGGKPLPFAIEPHVTEKLELTSNGNMAAATDGEFRVKFSNGDVVVIHVTATSMVLLSMEPNWSDGYSERYEYKTDVLTAWNGSEQRRALRQKPRYSAEFTVLENGDLARATSNAIRSWQNRMFAMPNWLCQTRTLSAVAPGSMGVNFDTKDLGFTPGEYLYILAPDGTFETLGVDVVTATGVTFKTQAAKPFPIGSQVFPVISGYMESSVSSTYVTDSVRTMTVKLKGDVLAYSTPLYASEYPKGELYNNVEIYPFKVDWASSNSVEWVSNSEMIDFGNSFQRIVEKGETLRILSVSTRLFNRAQVNKFKAFMARRKGRQVSFFMPTDNTDLVMVEDYTLNALDMQFRDSAMSGHMRNHQPYIRIQLAKKTYYRRLMLIEDAGNGIARATLDAPIPDNFKPSDVRKISFMHLARFGSDDITIRYTTSTVANVGLKLQEVIA